MIFKCAKLVKTGPNSYTLFCYEHLKLYVPRGTLFNFFSQKSSIYYFPKCKGPKVLHNKLSIWHFLHKNKPGKNKKRLNINKYLSSIMDKTKVSVCPEVWFPELGVLGMLGNNFLNERFICSFRKPALFI